jgi:fatty-acyl-CoA synthase
LVARALTTGIDLFKAASIHHSSRTAAVEYDTGRSFTYTDLERRGRALAGFLIDLGVSRGSSLACLHYNSVEAIDSLNAAWKLGAVYVPINRRLAPREIASILRDVKPRAVIVDSGLYSLARESISLARVSTHLIVTGCASSEAYCYEEALKTSGKRVHEGRASLEDTLMILYTGGTT